jgi:hypothetical protein
MAKTPKTPTYSFHLFYRRANCADEPPSPERWLIDNGINYAQVATIRATSHEEALTFVSGQSGPWYRHPKVTLLVQAPVRECCDGDVLVCDEVTRWSWMILSGCPVAIALPTSVPLDTSLERGAVRGVAWSPDGKAYISCGTAEALFLRVIGPDVSPNYTRHRYGFVYAVAWSPDASRIASGGSNYELHIWDVADLESSHPRGDASFGRILICRLQRDCGSFEGINAISWAPDNLFVAAGGHDGAVRVWHAATGRCDQTLKQQAPVRAASWSPDGKYLAAAGDGGQVVVWEPDMPQVAYVMSPDIGKLRALAWSPDSESLLVGGAKHVLVRYHPSMGVRKDIPLSIYSACSTGILAVTYAPDGQCAAVGCADGTVQIVDIVQNKHVHTFYGHVGAVNAVAWSPDGQHILSGGEDKQVQVWGTEAVLSHQSSPIRKEQEASDER